MIGAIVGLKSARDAKLYLPVTGGRYLPIDRDCLDETTHNNLQSVRVGALSFSSWFLRLKLYISATLHCLAHLCIISDV